MKINFVILLIVFMCFSCVSSSHASGFSQNADEIEKAADSVLLLIGADDSYSSITQGSGFIAFNSSTLITNYHVIDGLTSLFAFDDEDKDYENKYEIKYVLCADKEADIAILEFTQPTSLQPLELYPDDSLKRGSPVIAIGSPGGGAKNTVSAGVVSSSYNNKKGLPEIQTNAAISHGSSGGALFNDDGQVIGVTSATSAIEDTQNINFAVNIAVVQAMYNAWDGTKYTLAHHKERAEMDFSNVYPHAGASTENAQDQNSAYANEEGALWTCPACGSANTSRYCQECGTEKPRWVCVCGKVNNGKFCGACGKRAEDLVSELNRAIDQYENQRFDEAIQTFEALSDFDSGTIETIKGSHVTARSYLQEAYFENAAFLISVDGAHETILECLKKAEDFADSREKIYDAYYRYGAYLLDKHEFSKSREAFQKIINYKDSSSMILKTYFVEGMDAFGNQRYLDAIDLFSIAGQFPEASSYIPICYYELGKEALQNGDTDDAVYYFSQAGDYQDASALVTKIRDSEKEKKYSIAVELFNNGHFKEAEAAFTAISDFQDAGEWANKAAIERIRQAFNNTNETESNDFYSMLLSELSPLLILPEAEQLKKEIQYAHGLFCLRAEDFVFAMDCFVDAGDYLDAHNKVLEIGKSIFDDLLRQEQYESASVLLHKTLVPNGYNQECILMKPGDIGDIPEYVLGLIRATGLSRNIPKQEKEYKEKYVSAVQKFEDYFGMTVDGTITLDEYIIVYNSIYIGCTGNRVNNLVEKLCDLSYLRNLPANHSTYMNSYVNGIKNAEKALDLQPDGIVTAKEYQKIMSQKVELAEPELRYKWNNNTDILTFFWEKVPGAMKYIIYRNEEPLGETKENGWIIRNFTKEGDGSTYVVEAVKYTIQKNSNSIYIGISNGTLVSISNW